MQDLFERTVFRTPGGRAEYDPHTYTLCFPGPDLGGSSALVVLHEILHWIQHISYSFGGFRSALIHARDEFAINILSQYARLKDKCQRHQVRFSMPTSKAFFDLAFDHEWLEQDIWQPQVAWRDALICENLFLHMSSFYKEYHKEVSAAHELLQPELLIPRTLLRINAWAIDTLCYGSTKPQGHIEITDIDNHPKLSNFGSATHAGIELDTFNIIEGMAVAFEIYSLPWEMNARQRMEEIANTSYAPAISLFLEVMGFSVRYDNIARMAPMFLAITEMSLNPPLPPFGVINKLELDWNKIYPPLRFIELCHIAKAVCRYSGYIINPNRFTWILDQQGKTGLGLGGNLYTWIFDWIARVEALYLSQGGVFSYLFKDEDCYLPAEKMVPFLAQIAEEDPNMREILWRKGVNTIGMAEKFPDILVGSTGLELYAMLRHGHTLFMNWFGAPRPFLIPFEWERWGGLSMPPLIVFDECHATYGWSEDFVPYLINYHLFHYPLHDIMLGEEPRMYLPDHPIISEWRRSEIWKQLQETFSNVI